MLNDWNENYVQKAWKQWGVNYGTRWWVKEATKAINAGDSFLDIGCGFGRFYRFLCAKKLKITYMGYDNSEAMLMYHPAFSKVMMHDIIEPFRHHADVIVCFAVFIHLDESAQNHVLKNIKDHTCHTAFFDMHLTDKPNYERNHNGFRMMYNNEKHLMEKLQMLFSGRVLSFTDYQIGKRIHKRVFRVTKA